MKWQRELEPTYLFNRLLKRCSTRSQIKQIHAHLITTNTSLPTPLLSSLIHSYISFNQLSFASSLLSHSPPTSLLLWNLLIQSLSKPPNSFHSLLIFRRLLSLSVPKPDHFTLTFAVSAASSLSSPFLSHSLHSLALRLGVLSNLFVTNSLINAYSTLDRVCDARKLFDEMPNRDVISWTSLVKGYARRGEMSIAGELFDEMPERNEVSWAVMVAGYVRCGRYRDALQCFHDLLRSDAVKPNQAVVVCALSACAHLGALDQGKWIHVYLARSGVVPMSSNISTSLIDMYAKCGNIECATHVFDMSSKRDVLTWTSMISGLAMHGCGKEAVQLFYNMLAEGVKPDRVTLLGVLNGCSHAGLVNEGCKIFHDMDHLWGLSPTVEHYGCLIDLLGRVGHLEDAYRVVKSMPMEPDIVVWRALLSACRIYGHVGLGEKIIGEIAQLDLSTHGGGYTLLSNLYARTGRWDKVMEVRKVMNDKVRLKPGCSWIEIDGVVHEFLAADRLHPQIKEICFTLNEILKRVSAEVGYIPNTGQALFDLSEEEREQAIALHSEKLAIAFGLMHTPAGSLIRIVKNLRICEDCHSAMKAISLVFEERLL